MERFDLAVIGAGTAGLVTAAGAAGLGARVVLIERDRTGGECLYTGCVPTKALVKAAKVAHTVATAGRFGVAVQGVRTDYAGARAHMLATIRQIEHHDSPERFRSLGVTVHKGTARFISPTRLEVDGELLAANKTVIATGSRSVAPPIEGLAATGFWSHVEALAAVRLPRSVIVLGAGPIGLEFAQVWTRFGVQVTVLERAPQILIREDAEAAEMAGAILAAEGVALVTGFEAVRAHRDGTQKVIAGRTADGRDQEYRADELFVAAGRAPNLEELNLEAAGVAFDRRRILADASLRTTARNIWGVGDTVGPYLFTHTANYQGRLVVGNALLPVRRKADYGVVPWTTFLDPEIAHLGLTEAEAREQHGDGVKVFRYAMSDLDRAITDGEERGFVKVITDQRGLILGAHIVGPHAGDLIHELALAKREGIGIGAVSQMIHAYPTLAEGVQRAADQYWRERLFGGTSPAGRWLKRAVRLFN
ncbi:MAG TPA: FAD-dependent oxidoreductase [Symbiobacteriaceae bacterium]|jgi:pyruvate/2-oxoglutarate dehydrogenase complex dihydrolipoamide dehydrogenase (E3) component